MDQKSFPEIVNVNSVLGEKCIFLFPQELPLIPNAKMGSNIFARLYNFHKRSNTFQ